MAQFHLALLAASVAAVAGCSSQEQEARRKAVAIPNPASEYCEKLGGNVMIQESRQGDQRGVCHMKDGTRVDEWELFRRDNAGSTK
ncbi:hypothetical protein BIY45_01300 [Stenotrophomonas sp. BIIR7]|nr:hypothetical protein BIY45_01300 [Stenotrophomonas sp. BIIR7]